MIARFFVDRPIFATVISVVFVLAGGVALFTLPVALYPEVAPPTVQVTALFPGANAETLRDTVASPIEEQVSGVEGMLYMSSRCTNDGAYNLTVTFKQGADSDMAQVLVQNRVTLALPMIPPLVQNEGISVKKMSPNILMIVNLVSPEGQRSELDLSNYATIFVRDELGRVPGVAAIQYLGQRDYSLRAWLDPDRLATLNLTVNDVVSAIQKQNAQVAPGQLGQQPVPQGQQFQLTVNALGRLRDPEEFGRIVVKGGPAPPPVGAASATGGAPPAAYNYGLVYLRDVARVERGSQQYDQSCTLDGKPSVALSIYQLPGSNALETASAVYAKMKELKARFPDGLDYRIVYDTTPFIRESIHEVLTTLRDAVLLVALVVLFFLQDWRAMVLPMIDVPVSLIGTFAVMALLGYSLNSISLFGLVLAIGIVVDDAIVVLENIERLLATGLDARTATIQAMDEITGPVLAITLVLTSVFVPCCFLGGVSGQFFRQFAVTIAVSTIISAVNALTMTPSRAVLIFNTDGRSRHRKEALPWWAFAILGGAATWSLGAAWGVGAAAEGELGAAGLGDWPAAVGVALPGVLLGGLLGWWLIGPVNRALDRLFHGFNRLFDRVTDWYGRAVAGLLRFSAVVVLVYAVLLGFTWRHFQSSAKGFIPQQDKGYLLLQVQLPESASMERTQRELARVEALVRDVPGVKHTLGVCGQSVLLKANAPNLASLYVLLDDFDRRRSAALSADAIAAALTRRCGEEVREAEVTAVGAPPIDGLGSSGGFQLVIEDRGNLGREELKRAAKRIVQRGGQAPAVRDLFSSAGADAPWVHLDFDRNKCQALGVEVSDVFDALQGMIGSSFVNNYNESGRTWQVNVQADARFRRDPADLLNLQVRNRRGRMVRLANFITVRQTTGLVVLLRYNMYPAAAVSGGPAPGCSSGAAMAALQAAADQELPRTMAAEWTDLAFLQTQAGNAAAWFFALSVAFVFLVLAAQYESWSLPVAVILVVPMCLLCSLASVQAAHLEVTLFTQIGFIVLIGLASKNAILIVEFAKQKQDAGMGPREAVVAGSTLRLRPIIMTSFAFIFGVAPLVHAHGAGAEMRRSLGTAVFGGMLGVTAFGVFLTPVFYFLIQAICSRRGEKVALAPVLEKEEQDQKKEPYSSGDDLPSRPRPLQRIAK